MWTPVGAGISHPTHFAGEQNWGIVFAFSRPGGAVNVSPGPEGR